MLGMFSDVVGKKTNKDKYSRNIETLILTTYIVLYKHILYPFLSSDLCDLRIPQDFYLWIVKYLLLAYSLCCKLILPGDYVDLLCKLCKEIPFFNGSVTTSNNGILEPSPIDRDKSPRYDLLSHRLSPNEKDFFRSD